MIAQRTIVPLVRRFSSTLQPSKDGDGDGETVHSRLFGGGSCGWEVIEEKRRCVIIAGAGAGKTHEMLSRARYAADRGRCAFFVRIENIGEAFGAAFDVGELESFETWLSSEEDAWFFLDSVDEALLSNPQAFEEAIRVFATRIADARHRAYVIISSRSYAWRNRSDRELLEQLLPYEAPSLEEMNAGEADEESNFSALDSTDLKSSIEVYTLDDLDDDDIRMFAAHLGAVDIEGLLQEIQRLGLTNLSGRPFDLLGILSKWRSDRRLGGRLDYLRHSIVVQLAEVATQASEALEEGWLHSGARRLAAAVILTGGADICIPDMDQSERGIDAAQVLPDWSPEALIALLKCGLFNDAIYGVVRFRHRDVRELLAAEWFAGHLMDTNRRPEIEVMLFREQYGERIITPRFRPILPWLVLLDEGVRRDAASISPEIAVEGGDVASLPVEERRTLLDSIVKQIAQGEDDRGARDNDAIARIAQADLAPEVMALIDRYSENNDALFFLGRLVWQGQMKECVPALMDIVCNPASGLYARIAATRAVYTAGSKGQQDALWDALLEVQIET
jgi:hypothetical protein